VYFYDEAKMKKLSLVFLSLVNILPLNSCGNDRKEITSPINLFDDMYDNIPVIVNTENSFTFTVVANNLNYFYENDLYFSEDSLVYTITLNNASSNNSYLNLLDSDGHIIISESLNSSSVIVNTELDGDHLNSINIELNGFSGLLTIVVALKNP
jgi:hypothetical protein